MNKKLIAASALTIALAMPGVLLAFDSGGLPNAAPNLSINSIIDVIFGIIWPVVIAFAIIMFILAGFLFLTAQGDPSKIAQGRQAVIWGVVGVVVALLAFSIPFVVRNTLGQNI